MPTAAMTPAYEFFSVAVPRMEAKKFKTIVKVLGFECVPQKKSGMDKAIEDIQAGRIKTMASIDEFVDSLAKKGIRIRTLIDCHRNT